MHSRIRIFLALSLALTAGPAAAQPGLGACMMAGPMVARDDIHALLKITEPWRMVGAIALGYSAQAPSTMPRKPIDKVVDWIEEEP